MIRLLQNLFPVTLKFAIIVILFAIVSACAGSEQNLRAFDELSVQPYRVDSGDRLLIKVYEQADLSGSYGIGQEGYLSFPLIGAVGARGKTVRELEFIVAAKLKKGFLRDPYVSIEIDQYRPFFILGEVNQPGQYSYVPAMSVQNAVAIAGGFSSRANQKTARITRKINSKIISRSVIISSPILAGDTIYIHERLF